MADREFKDLFKHPFLTGRSPTAHPAVQPNMSPGFLGSNSPRVAIAPTPSPQVGRDKPPNEAYPPSHGWNGVQVAVSGAPHGSGPPPPHQLAAGHRIASGLSGQLMPAASATSAGAPGRSSPRGATPPSSGHTGQHAESPLPAPPPNSDASAPYPQAMPVAVADHLPKSQGVPVSAADASGLPSAVRLQVQQTPSQSRNPPTTGFHLVQIPGGQIIAYAPGASPQHAGAASLQEGGHGIPEGEGARYVTLDGVSYVPSPVASGVVPQTMRPQHKAPPGGTRGGAHDQQPHSQQIQLGGTVGSAAVDIGPIEHVGSGPHAHQVMVPVHSSALGNFPVALAASGESLSSYAAAAASAASADGGNDGSTPSQSHREESQGAGEGHGDESAQGRARALSGGHTPSEDSLTACSQRRRSNPQLQGPLPPRPAAGNRRASSETRQCATEFSGASSVASADDAATPGRTSKTNSAGTALAAGLDGTSEGAAACGPEQGTPVHVLNAQNFHTVKPHHPHDYQMLRPYLQQSYVAVGGGTGAHHTGAHIGVPSSQGPSVPIYLAPAPAGEGLHGGVMRAGVPGGPVVMTTAAMASGHHVQLPVVPGQPLQFIPSTHGHAHTHISHSPQAQQGAAVAGGPGSSMGPQLQHVHGVQMLVPQQHLAHGIEGPQQYIVLPHYVVRTVPLHV